MRSSRPLTLRVVLTALAVASGCARSGDSSATPGDIPAWTVGPSPALSIGTVDGDSAYIFSHVSAVRLLPSGGVLVADRSSGTLRVFDARGDFTRQMGRVGQGPGEFAWLGEAFVWPPDTIAAYDSEAGRLSRFDGDGAVASTVTFRAPDGLPEIYLGRYADGSHGAAWIKQVPMDPSRLIVDRMQMARFSPDGTSATMLGTEGGMWRRGSPVPLSPSFLAVLVGDTLFHSDGLGGVVTATGPDGDTVRVFQVPGESDPLGEAYRDLQAVLDTADLRRLRDVRGQSGTDTVPTLSDMLADDEGQIWAKRYAPATDSHWVLRRRTGGEWIVVTTSGTPVARVVMPEDFRLVDVRGSRIAGVSRDQLGIERVQVYVVQKGLLN